MIKNLLSLISIFLFTQIMIFGQNTVGLLSYEPSKAFEGYNLIYPHNQPNVYLLNNCGEIVHVWEDEPDVRPGNTAYLLDDGRLVKAKRPAAVAGNPIWAGGGGATVEIRDWDNNLEWSFTLNDSLDRLHHDIAIVERPNNEISILMIAWELKTEAEALQAGRDTSTTAQDKLWPDYILEVDPSTDQIIWEWHAWDHLIQDFDDTKDNYGIVEDHPELIDINYDTNNGHPDWLHSNALDYNQELRQIILSVPYFDEVWVIDHTTTTAQAAGHVGGMAGRGGDLIYRWGNPAAYRQGTADDQTLFFAHDIQWVDDYLTPNTPHFGKMAAFNNRVGANFSTINIFTPSWDMYKWTYTKNNNVWGPWQPNPFDVDLTHPTPTALHSTGLSSVQLLPNGNFLICSGRWGYSFELTPEDEIVWEYKTPLIGGSPATQGDTLSINNNLTFRLKRIPADEEVFVGKDLSPKGWLELEPDSTFCDRILPATDVMKNYFLEIYPNPATDILTIEWEGGIYADVKVFDLLGREVEAFRASGGRKYIDVSEWSAGMYIVEIGGIETQKLLISK